MKRFIFFNILTGKKTLKAPNLDLYQQATGAFWRVVKSTIAL